MPDYIERGGFKISSELVTIAGRKYTQEHLESIMRNEGEWMENQSVVGELKERVRFARENGEVCEKVIGYLLIPKAADGQLLNLVFERKPEGEYGLTEACYELIFGRVIDPKSSFEEIRRKITGSYLMTRELSPEDMRRLKLIGQVLV